MIKNHNQYLKLEKEVLDFYEIELKKINYTLERNVRLKEQYYIQIDGLIKNEKGNPLAIIEVKEIINQKNISSISLKLYRVSNYINCKFIIITDKKSHRFYYLDDEKNLSKYRIFDNVSSTINYLKELVENEKEENKKEQIESRLKEEDFKLKNINSLFKENKKFIELEDNKYSFSKNFEDEIFKRIINYKEEIKTVCRYTTFESLFYIIKNGTFRMNGICGMNDKTEVNYVENYIYEENKEWNITKSNLDKEKINNTFITSCCNEEIKDNLTLWRLYANDAKGVCLIFEIDDKKLKDFLFGEVIYNVYKLDVLKNIIQITKEIAPNSMFVFKSLSQYKHFFKPSDYEDEKEIRLVYLNDKSKKIKKDWFLAQPFNLLNPFIEFNLFNNDFPLILKEVILGPKCLEQEMNKIQLETLLKEKGFNDVKVKNSNIKHYR